MLREVEASQSLEDRLARWSVENVSVGLAVTDLQGTVLVCNPAFASATQRTAEETIGISIFDVFAQSPKSTLASVYRDLTKTGSARAVLSIGFDEQNQWELSFDFDRTEELVFVQSVDQTEISRLHFELRKQTIRDRLTGLENRDALKDRLDSALATKQPIALFIIDVDQFTMVNDTYGHEFGDEVLRVLSSRITGMVGRRNTTARIGGDQFAVMVRRVANTDEVHASAEELHRALTGPMVIGTTSIHLELSVGYTVSDENTKDANDLLREADTALVRVNEEGGNKVQRFQHQYYAEIEERMLLERDLRAAIGSDQLTADLQGIFCTVTRELVGFEALARWRHPTRGNVPPDVFIAVADRHRLLRYVLSTVLDRSLATLAGWLAADRSRYVSVNVAPSQLVEPELVPTIATALEMSGVAPEQLIVEITEQELVSDAASREGVNNLKSLGLRIAIDDFGAGASALGYLWTLPVSILKLDRSLIASMSSDPAAHRTVAAVVRLARDLGLETVAEGIEDEEQLTTLADQGCPHAQGFLLHRPTPIDAVGQLIGADGVTTASAASPDP